MMELFKYLAGNNQKKIPMPCGEKITVELFTNDVKDFAHVATGVDCENLTRYIYGESSGEALNNFKRIVQTPCNICTRVQAKGK